MTEHTRDDLERARAKWWATVSSGDLDGYLSLFAEDAVWVTPELDEIVGRDAIRAWLEPVFAQFDYELTITVADVRVAGDLGIERARFVSRMTPKPVAPPAPLSPGPLAAAPVPAPLPAQQWVPGDDEATTTTPSETAGPGEGDDGPAPTPPVWGEGAHDEPGGEPAASALPEPTVGPEPTVEPEPEQEDAEPEPEPEPE